MHMAAKERFCLPCHWGSSRKTAAGALSDATAMQNILANGTHVTRHTSIPLPRCGSNTTSPFSCSINLMDPRPSAPVAALPAEVRRFGLDWTLSLLPRTVLMFNCPFLDGTLGL
ncbi:unnamed protein product [Durusdinium trenchii]|eukprot:g4512.t1